MSLNRQGSKLQLDWLAEGHNSEAVLLVHIFFILGFPIFQHQMLREGNTFVKQKQLNFSHTISTVHSPNVAPLVHSIIQ